VSEWSQRDRHGLRTVSLVIVTLTVVFGAICAVVLNLTSLDQITFLGFPLGYYLLAQGLLIGIVAASFWTASLQDRSDRALFDSDEI
jgi:putative solute:sodium symporter small subunit